MDISESLVYDIDMKLLGETCSYPLFNAHYRVDMIHPKDNHLTYTNHYVPKPVYHMVVALKALRDKISRKEMIELISIFNDYGSWKYHEAYCDASMENDSDL